MKVALDAMGGDHAPAVNIGGAKEALQLYPSIEKIFLVGDEETIRAECQKQGLSSTHPRVAIVPRPCLPISMKAKPTRAIPWRNRVRDRTWEFFATP